MAVLTPIDPSDVSLLAVACGLPAPAKIEGIAGGSVNSNFTFEAGARRFFLRIYEERDLAGALRETAMLERLARAGVPTPQPVARTDGGLVSVVRGKPAALFPWREGTMRCQAGVTPEDALSLGEALARVHEAGRNETPETGRFRFEDLEARLDTIQGSGHELAAVAPGLRASLHRVHAARVAALPSGLIHGDLFRDNVLWEGARLSALLDFESACAGTLAYDLMVTLLAWCFGDHLDAALASALLAGYERVRTLEPAERQGLHAEAELAALRFTITRITDYAMRSAEGPRVIKDWRRFLKRFEMLEALGAAGLRKVFWP